MDLLVQQFLFGQIFKVAIIKTKSATIKPFFSSLPFFLLALSFSPSFSFVSVILELIAHKKPVFWRISLKSPQISLGCFQKIGSMYNTKCYNKIWCNEGKNLKMGVCYCNVIIMVIMLIIMMMMMMMIITFERHIIFFPMWSFLFSLFQ